MKISKDTYNIIKSEISQIVNILQIDLKTMPGGKTGSLTMWNLFHHANCNRSYDNNHPGYGQIIRILPYTGRDYCWYYGKREDNINDSHIEMVLRKIKGELTN